MTYNEIIKALKEILKLMCNEGDLQRSATISNALDLINRQNAEIEELKKVDYFQWKKDLKAEAYKEFADRLKDKALRFIGNEYHTVLVDDIDNLLKELVGENNVK